MILPTYLQNVDSVSPNIGKSILRHIFQILHTALFSNLFRLDLPLFGISNLFNRSDPPLSGFSNLFNKSDLPQPNYKKTDKEAIDKFLWCGVYCCINIKDFSPK